MFSKSLLTNLTKNTISSYFQAIPRVFRAPCQKWGQRPNTYFLLWITTSQSSTQPENWICNPSIPQVISLGGHSVTIIVARAPAALTTHTFTRILCKFSRTPDEMPTRHLSWLHFHHQPWDPEWLHHSSLPKDPLLHLQPDSFGPGEPSEPVWLTPAGHRPLLQVPPATLNLTYFVFNRGNLEETEKIAWSVFTEVPFLELSIYQIKI